MTQKIQFDNSRAKKYRKRLEVLAFQTTDPILFYKSWGDLQLRSGGWVIVSLTENGEPDGDIYGCDEAAFYDTYELVPDKPNHYRKSGIVNAYQPGHSFEVDTILPDGFVEVKGGHADVADAWIIQAPGGETYTVQDAKFRKMYVEVGS